jgi:hypothetical protein
MNSIKQPDILLQKLDIEDQLSCPVCTNTYYNPITLLCQHTFCYHCITDSNIKECPICRTKKFIPIDANTKSVQNIMSQITNLYYGTDNIKKIGLEVDEYLEEKTLGPEIQKKTNERLKNMLNNMAVKQTIKKPLLTITSVHHGINLHSEPVSPYRKYFSLLKYVGLLIMSAITGFILGGFLLNIGNVIKTKSNFIPLIYSFMRVLTAVSVTYQYYKHIIVNSYLPYNQGYIMHHL